MLLQRIKLNIYGRRNQVAFDNLKRALTSSLILSFPKEDGKFILDLFRRFKYRCWRSFVKCKMRKKEHIIAYYSQVLNKAERNYCVTRRELFSDN